MCRVFKPSAEEKSNPSSSANMVEKHLFEFLVDQALNYIKDQVQKHHILPYDINLFFYFSPLKKNSIEKELKEKCAPLETNENNNTLNTMKTVNKIQVRNYLDNVLTLDIVKLLCTMVKYDILSLLNKKDEFSVIVSNLVHLLEFDRKNPTFSYCLIKKRGLPIKNLISHYSFNLSKLIKFVKI